MSGISSKRLANACRAHGWRHDRTKGSHGAWVKEGEPRPITLQEGVKDLPEFIVANILRQLGITKKDFQAKW